MCYRSLLRAKLNFCHTKILFFLIIILLNNHMYGQETTFKYDIYIDEANWVIPFSEFETDLLSIKNYLSVPDAEYPVVTIGEWITPTVSGDNIVIPELPTGVYKFFFRDLKAEDPNANILAWIIVSKSRYLLQGLSCEPDCNYISNGDFTEYPISEEGYLSHGMEGAIFGSTGRNRFTSTDSPNYNGVHVSSNESNRFLRFLEFCTSEEYQIQSAYIIKLNNIIKPGDEVDVSFDYGFSHDLTGDETPIPKHSGKIRFYGLISDINPFDNEIDLPDFCSTTPATLNGSQDAYCMLTSIPTDYLSLDYTFSYLEPDENGHFIEFVRGGGINEFSDIFTLGQYLAFEYPSDAVFKNKQFTWQNTTAEDIEYVLIVPGEIGTCHDFDVKAGNRDVLPVSPYPEVYLFDNFSILPHESKSICIEGDNEILCTGNCTHIVSYEVCYCGEKPLEEEVAFDVSIDDLYSGIEVILPSGDFDSNGKARVVLDPEEPCTTLTFQVDIDYTILEGEYELPLNLGASGGCIMCEQGFHVESFTIATVTMEDCNFTCQCMDGINIGVKNTSTNWSSLSSDDKKSDCFAVEGNLVFNQDVDLTNKTFIMQDNSTVTIGDNDVSFSFCHFLGCEVLWNGIKMTHAGGSIRLLGSSVVEDAIKGVTRVVNGAFIYIDDTRFIDNYIGLSLDYDFINPGAPTTSALVMNTGFTSTGLLDHPTYHTLNKKGYSGISSSSISESFGDLNKAANQFIGLGYGITYSNYSVTSVVKSKFENILPLSYYNGSGIGINQANQSAFLNVGSISDPNVNLFTNVYTGINAHHNTTVHKAKMSNVTFGILYDASHEVGSIKFLENNITAKKIGISVNNTSGFLNSQISYDTITEGTGSNQFKGIYVNSGNTSTTRAYFNINNNRIFGNDHFARGIDLNYTRLFNVYKNYIEGSTSNVGWQGISGNTMDHSIIEENHIVNSFVGLPSGPVKSHGLYLNMFDYGLIQCNEINSTNYGISVSGNNTWSYLITNIMDDNKTIGLNYSKTASMSSAHPSMTQYLGGNQFTGTQPLPARHLASDPDLILASAFRTNSNSLPIFPTGYTLPNATGLINWWVADVLDPDPTGGDCLVPGPDPDNPDFLIPFALDSIDYSIYDDEMKVQGRSKAYKFMLEYPGLTYGTPLSSFASAYSSTYEGHLIGIRNDIKNAVTMPEDSADAIDALHTLIDSEVDDLVTLQGTVPSPPTVSDINTYKTAVQTINSNISSYLTQIKNIENNVEDDRDYDITILLGLLDNPPNSELVTNNMFNVTKHELDYWLNASTLTDEIVVSDLLDIAALCPDYGGPAVHWARALLRNAIPNITWNDTLECAGVDSLVAKVNSEEFKNKNEDKSEKVTMGISPVPSTGVVSIIISGANESNLFVYDNIGNLIRYYRKAPQTINIDLSGRPGIYYFKLINLNGKELITKKSIIIN